MERRIFILLSLLTLTIRINAQFYDLFQSFQPNLHNPTARPTFDFFGDFAKPKQDASRRRIDGQKTQNTDLKDNVRTTTKPKRKTTQSLLYNIDHTTSKPLRKTNKNNSNQRIQTSNKNKSQNRRQFYEDTANNVDYYTERTTRRITTKQHTFTTRPNYNSNYDSFTQRPGVRPANVDVNRPPITNRPPTTSAFAVYPIATDASAIRYPEDPDTSPEVLVGPDEDRMSSAERRRYISLSEKMCDKYKSLNIQRVQAIPLLPSPEPVQVNVSVCAPTTVPLVVGGKVVSIEEFPHMALLGWTNVQGGGYSWKCGGSLVSEQYVLTAGHCASQEKDDAVVSGAPRVVQLGSSYMDDTGALVVKVLNVVRHPKYSRPKSYYDVALVKLVRAVTFSQVIRPACLGDPPGVGDPVIITGWGRTKIGGNLSLELRSVSVPIWDIEECRQVLGVSRKMPEGPSRESQVCAGEKQGGKDACQGDSGGPAQIQDGCVWRVVAVTSIGRSCGAANTPGLYATVHKAFIAAQIFGKTGDQTNSNSQTNNQGNRNQNNNNRPQSTGNVNNNGNSNAFNWNNPQNNNNQNSQSGNNNQQSLNNKPNRNNNNNQNSWNTNNQQNSNNNNPNNWSTNNQQNSNNNRNQWNTPSPQNTNNNNQNSWNTNNNNHNSWSTSNPQTTNNNQYNWNQPNSNNGNWNGEYQTGNNNNNKPNRNNNGNQNPGVSNTNRYDSGLYKPEIAGNYGNNRREFNYNNNNNDYDDYYDRQQRNNNFGATFVTTKRPTYSWPDFGF